MSTNHCSAASSSSPQCVMASRTRAGAKPISMSSLLTGMIDRGSDGQICAHRSLLVAHSRACRYVEAVLPPSSASFPHRHFSHGRAHTAASCSESPSTQSSLVVVFAGLALAQAPPPSLPPLRRRLGGSWKARLDERHRKRGQNCSKASATSVFSRPHPLLSARRHPCAIPPPRTVC